MPRRREFVLGAIKAKTKPREPSSGVTINIGSGSTVNIAQGEQGIAGAVNAAPIEMNAAERERHYRICHAIAKQLDLYPEMRKFMKEGWRAESMRQLSDPALQMLLKYMRDFEKAAAAR